MRVLIAGCGDVGGALGRQLAAAGHDVYGLRRTVSKLPSELKPIAADLSDPATLTNLPKIDWLFYTTASDGPGEENYRRAYVQGLRNVLDAVHDQRATIKHLFFTSSTSVYHQDNQTWVNEDSPTQPKRYSGKILLEAEAIVANSGIPNTSVRYSGIYGPGRTWLLRKIRDGYTALSDRPHYTNRIHRDDAAAALVHLAQLKKPAPCYVVTDDEPVAMDQVVTWVRDYLTTKGHPPAPAQAPTSSERPSKRCSNQKLRETGFQLRYPTYREGYTAVIDSWLDSEA